MIGKITGLLEYLGSDHVVIDVNGVGYEVFLSDRAISSLPALGERVSVFTEMVVREDLLQIVGFLARSERSWYRLLISVQGVGSKAALKILGTVGVNILFNAILSDDVTAIKATPGVGTKIAQRIVSELKDKAPETISESLGTRKKPLAEDSSEMQMERVVSNVAAVENHKNDGIVDQLLENSSVGIELQAEALSALKHLGYSATESAQAIAKVITSVENIENFSQLVKLALHQLAPRDFS